MGASAAIEAVASSTPTNGQLVASWEADLDVRPRTKAGYERALRTFERWMDAQGLDLVDATRADLLAYRDHLAANYGASTVAAYLVPVRGLYGWAYGQMGKPSPADGIHGPKAAKIHARDALTKGQAREAVSVAEAKAEGGSLAALRDAAILVTLMTCGLRTIEASRACVGDVRNLAGRRVLYVQGKGRDAKDDYVVLPAKAARAIDRYLAARGPLADDAPLFAGHGNRSHGHLTTRHISQICKDAMREAGIDSPRITAHSLRHTAVTAALIGGATIQQAQAMARHARIETTLIYAHNLERMEHPAEDAAASYLS